MATKAWVDVPPTQSVPGTEDDETFYKLADERKERVAKYKRANAEMYRAHRGRWYLANRIKELERPRNKRRLRNMIED